MFVTGGLDCRSLCRFLPLIPDEWIAIFSDLDPSHLPGGVGAAVRINLHSILCPHSTVYVKTTLYSSSQVLKNLITIFEYLRTVYSNMYNQYVVRKYTNKFPFRKLF